MKTIAQTVIQVNAPNGQPTLLWVRLVQRSGGLTVRIGQLIHQSDTDGYPVAKLVASIGMYGSFVNRLYQVNTAGEYQWNEFELALAVQRYFHQVNNKREVMSGKALTTQLVKATGDFWRK